MQSKHLTTYLKWVSLFKWTQMNGTWRRTFSHLMKVRTKVSATSRKCVLRPERAYFIYWFMPVNFLDVNLFNVLWYGTCGVTVWPLSKTDLRVSSVQCGLPSPAESSFTPESCRSLVLRSSSLRLEELELRTEARASQLLSDRWQWFSL